MIGFKLTAQKPYFHELSSEEQDTILTSGKTVEWLLENYRQPDWCEYPEALADVMGCWSLMEPGRIRSVRSCINCDVNSRRQGLLDQLHASMIDGE